jgi:hypothetical protein
MVVFKVGVGSAKLAIGHFGHDVCERLCAQIKLVWLRYVNLLGAWHRHVDHLGHEASQKNTPVTDNPMSYVGYGFPLDVISYAVWL